MIGDKGHGRRRRGGKVGGDGDTTRATIGGKSESYDSHTASQPGWKECGRGGRGRWYNTGDSGGGSCEFTDCHTARREEGGRGCGKVRLGPNRGDVNGGENSRLTLPSGE